MAFWDNLQTDFKDIVEGYGVGVRFKYYTGSVASTEWDDAQVLSQSGTDIWTSGLAFPVTNVQGSNEAILLAQGKIELNDKKLFVPGDISTTPIMKIGLGNTVSEEYFVVPDGVTCYPPFGDMVYKKIFIRALIGGSFIGEQ